METLSSFLFHALYLYYLGEKNNNNNEARNTNDYQGITLTTSFVVCLIAVNRKGIQAVVKNLDNSGCWESVHTIINN